MHCPPILSKLSTTWAFKPIIPNSNTENKPTGPAPITNASVLIFIITILVCLVSLQQFHHENLLKSIDNLIGYFFLVQMQNLAYLFQHL